MNGPTTSTTSGLASPAPIAASSPAATSQVEYRRSVDLARFVAAFGIVWDHAHAPFADIGYTALALFLMLTAFLSMGSFGRSGGKGFWFSRAKRIFMPWVFWSAFYIAVNYRVWDGPGPFRLLNDPFTLLIGSYIHLWFLPFVTLALALIPIMSRTITTPRHLWLACIALVVISLPLAWLSLPIAWIAESPLMPEPLPQWAYSLPLFLYGAIVALGRRMNMEWLPLATAALISAVTFISAPEFAALQMILTAVIFEAVWRVDLRGTWATTLAGFAFGMYILHPFFMLLAFKLFGTAIDPIFAALFMAVGSCAAVLVLRHVPLVRQFV